jgi:sugar phosphate isomerase/epimerase
MTRRQFAATLAAAVPPAPAGRPKIGCLSWCFHPFTPGADPSEAIDIIGPLGFDGTELIVLSKPDLSGFWTASRIDQLRKQLDKYRLQVSQFVLFQPVVEGLTSTDSAERERNLDAFETGCRIGAQFSAPIINIVAPWPRELKGPTDYLPRYYDISDPKPGEKFHIDIAPGFDWEQLWQSYIRTTRACLERARRHKLRLTIEHHTHTMIPDAASFLRLWDAIRDPALGYNLDLGWTASHRDYPPVAIHKVKRHLMNVHARDIDGQMRRFPHVGEGVMDFKAAADALKAAGFSGFISLEQDKHPGDMLATVKRYLAMMKEYLA